MFTNSTDTVYAAWENQVAGSISLSISVVLLIIYLPCMYIFGRDKDLSIKACYRIMFHLGLSDQIQLLTAGVVAGAYALANSTGPVWLMDALGALAGFGWMGSLCHGNLLAFNRFVQVCFPTSADKIFSPKRARWFLLAGWTPAMIWLVCFSTGYMNIQYYLDINLWYYGDAPYSMTLAMIEMYVDYIISGMMSFWYICIFARLKIKPLHYQNQQQAEAGKKERKILFQAGIIYLVLVQQIIIFFTIPNIYVGQKWPNFAVAVSWIITSGINPFIYLVFNSQLRKKMKEMLGLGIQTAKVGPRSSQGGRKFSSQKGVSKHPRSRY